MPTPKAKPAAVPDFIPAETPDFIPAESSSAPQQTMAEPPDEPSGLQKFGDALLPDAVLHPVDTAKSALSDLQAHPLKTLASAYTMPQRGIYHTIKDSNDERGSALESLFHGNPAEAAVHGLKSIPIVGPAMVKAAETPGVGGTGSYLGDLKSTVSNPEAMGTLTGAAAQVAPLILGAADTVAPERPQFGQIPTRARAGALLESVNRDLAETPVNLNSTLQPLQRATEVGTRGGKFPTPLSSFLQRSQAIEPMTFPEARDYQSNLSSMSREDSAGMNGPMRGATKQVNKGLFQDMRDTADTANPPRGDDYAKGMRDYRRAAILNKGLTATGKAALKALPYAGTMAAGAGAYKLLKDLF